MAQLDYDSQLHMLVAMLQEKLSFAAFTPRKAQARHTSTDISHQLTQFLMILALSAACSTCPSVTNGAMQL